jgi:hypothetical protein
MNSSKEEHYRDLFEIRPRRGRDRADGGKLCGDARRNAARGWSDRQYARDRQHFNLHRANRTDAIAQALRLQCADGQAISLLSHAAGNVSSVRKGDVLRWKLHL